jgi:hypothetical protein
MHASAVGLALVACSSSGDDETRDDVRWTPPPCEEPHGEIHRVTSPMDAQTRLEGAWMLCSGGLSGQVPLDVSGVEMGQGKMHFLRREGEALARTGPARDTLFVDHGTVLHRRERSVPRPRRVRVRRAGAVRARAAA